MYRPPIAQKKNLLLQKLARGRAGGGMPGRSRPITPPGGRGFPGPSSPVMGPWRQPRRPGPIGFPGMGDLKNQPAWQTQQPGFYESDQMGTGPGPDGGPGPRRWEGTLNQGALASLGAPQPMPFQGAGMPGMAPGGAMDRFGGANPQILALIQQMMSRFRQPGGRNWAV